MYGLLTKCEARWLDIGQVLFLHVLDRDRVEVHKLSKKEQVQYPAILTKQAWSIKDLLYGGHGRLSQAGKIAPYYMASFASGQDEPNRVL